MSDEYVSRYWTHCITASLVPSVEGGSGDETISLQVQSRTKAEPMPSYMLEPVVQSSDYRQQW